MHKILHLSLCLSLISACGPAPNEAIEKNESPAAPIATPTPSPMTTPSAAATSDEPAPEATPEATPEMVSIRIENLPEQLNPGDSVEPKAFVVYDDGSEKEGVSFFSSNTDVLLKEGNFLKGQRPGSSTVTFQSRRNPEIKTKIEVTVGDAEVLGVGKIFPSTEGNTRSIDVLNSFLGHLKPGTELEYTMRFAGASLSEIKPGQAFPDTILLSQDLSVSGANNEVGFQERVESIAVRPNQEMARFIIRVKEALEGGGHQIEISILSDKRLYGNRTPITGEYFAFNYADLFDGFLEQKSKNFNYLLSQTAENRKVEANYPRPGSTIEVQEYTSQDLTAPQGVATELVQYLLHKDLGVVKKIIQFTRTYTQLKVHAQVELELTGYKAP